MSLYIIADLDLRDYVTDILKFEHVNMIMYW